MIGGGVGRDPNPVLAPALSPSDVPPKSTGGEEPTISSLPQDLEQIVDYAYPDSLWTAYERLSGSSYVVWVLDVDGSYNELVANLNLDFNWTLSPKSGPCYENVTTPDDGGEPLAWRQRQNRAASQSI